MALLQRIHYIQFNSVTFSILELPMALTTPLLPHSATNSDSDSVHIPSPHKSLAVLSGHTTTISSLALCGEFLLSASHARDIIVWQQPDLRQFTRFGHGDGSVKALIVVGTRVFTAHQDSRIRVWKLSTSSENVFRLVSTLPTTKDYLAKFMVQKNYVQMRRNGQRKLWIEHADSISCLAVSDGFVYSGSWDKTLKVWRISDLRCLESIKAHDDAINAVAAHGLVMYSASADGKIKVWERQKGDSIHSTNPSSHCLKKVLGGRSEEMSWNAVVVCGRFVYGGGSDGWVMGWEEGEKVCDVKAHEMSVLCLCSTEEFVCSGSADRSIGVWRRGEGGGLCRVGVMKGHEGPVKCLQASWNSVGEGFMLYSGGLDKRLRVWWVPKDYKEEIDSDHKLKGVVLLR